jgi:putative flavoprotein involved in K+ transport
VTMRPRVVGAIGRTIRFADGTELDVDAVVWATGFRPDYSWLDLPVVDSSGQIRHRRGVTDVPGLYFLGLSWQHTRGSALLGWVAEDAEFIAAEIDKPLAIDAREHDALDSTEPATAAATEGA